MSVRKWVRTDFAGRKVAVLWGLSWSERSSTCGVPVWDLGWVRYESGERNQEVTAQQFNGSGTVAGAGTGCRGIGYLRLGLQYRRSPAEAQTAGCSNSHVLNHCRMKRTEATTNSIILCFHDVSGRICCGMSNLQNQALKHEKEGALVGGQIVMTSEIRR